MLRFVEPSRDMRCSFVNELVSGAEKIGVVWKSKDTDNFCSWALGDGSRQFGLASSIEGAKAALVQASGKPL